MMTDVQMARELAIKWHDGQKRWGGEDYFLAHIEPIAIKASTLYGYDSDEVIVAYLHDILEDTLIPEETLVIEFDSHILDAVLAITKKTGEDYAEYLQIVGKNALASRVKILDIQNNLSSLREGKDKQRRDKYKTALLYLCLCGY